MIIVIIRRTRACNGPKKTGVARSDEIYQLTPALLGIKAQSNNARDSGMPDLSWQHTPLT